MLAILKALGLLRGCGHPPLLHGCDPPFSPRELAEMERDPQRFIERNPHLFPKMFPPTPLNRLLKKKEVRAKKKLERIAKKMSRKEKRLLEGLKIRCAAKE